MKNLTVLFGVIALVLSSCGTHNALRYVKTNPNQQIVQTQPAEVSSEEVIPMNEQRVNSTLTTQNESVDVQHELASSVYTSYPDTTSWAEEPEINTDEASDAVAQAQRSEKRAKASKNLGIAGLAMSLLSFLAFIGFFLMIASLILYISANRARYNTEEGVNNLRKAKIVLIIYGALIALGVLLTILLILLFI
jgi:ATP-dependent Zn protease